MSPLFLLVLWSAPGLISASEAVDEAVALVARALETPEDLALTFEAEPDLPGLDRLFQGLLVHRLERRWPESSSLRLLEPNASAEMARDAGAEWLLRLTLRREDERGLALQVELRQVDRGFWWPAPSMAAAAAELYRVRLDETLHAWMKTPKSSRVSGLSSPEPWLELDEPVLDLVGCELDSESPGEELVVLTRERVNVYRLSERGPTFWMSHRLSGDPPPERLRWPRGRVHCRSDRPTGPELVLGTTDRARGYRLALDRARGVLVEGERLPGIPLVLSAEGHAELAAPDPDSGGYRLLQSGRVVLDVVTPGPESFHLLPPGAWVRSEANPAEFPTPIALGGLGGSAARTRESSWVTTSSTAWRGPDHLTLRGSDGRPVGRSVSVPAPVRASGFVQGPDEALMIVIAVGRALEPRSTLMRLRFARPAEVSR